MGKKRKADFQRRKQRADCRRKWRFATGAEAILEAMDREANPDNPRRSDVRLYSYRCPHCGRHHLTKNPPRDSRR